MSLKKYIDQLRQKGVVHWLVATLLIMGGVYLGDEFGKSQRWIDWRYKLYRYQTKGIRPKLYPQRTVLVVIGDDEYWRGEFARRSPIKRDRLANLLRVLDSTDPAVIAMDFDLRSPVPTGEIRENSEYLKETDVLLETIAEISHRRSIVVPKTISLSNRQYISDSDIFDGFDFRGGNVVKGYITLPFDMRVIPLTLPVVGIGPLDSFAQAVVKADNKKVPGSGSNPSYSLPFGTFMTPDSFTVVQAKDILAGVQSSLNELPHKVVIVGADWSRLAFGRGPKVDLHLSPVGEVGGIFLHANYVEALIGEHVYQPLGSWVTGALDVGFAILIAVGFALNISGWYKAGIAFLALIVAVVLSYFFLQNLGSFFDFFVPSLLVALHAGIERIREWREAYLNQEARV